MKIRRFGSVLGGIAASVLLCWIARLAGLGWLMFVGVTMLMVTLSLGALLLEVSSTGSADRGRDKLTGDD